ncbi:MAG TPA: hypothetical protein VLF18_00090 [Tahibacter sp.]|uniref:hypothetical protein n=1 Tax=Tahibacter sp. TaxID=2056211 RepID=UPI002D10F843|nr:hypothetical protein [Tahibacter sp.]HSX58570.1 hypothetical protein [Tahibacter sp.]
MAFKTQEMILALRAPNAHWLAALVNALDEALKDPDFGPEQRALVQQLLQAGIVPASVARAAEARFERFEQSFTDFAPIDGHAEAPAFNDTPVPPSRPKLTLVGSNAAA